MLQYNMASRKSRRGVEMSSVGAEGWIRRVSSHPEFVSPSPHTPGCHGLQRPRHYSSTSRGVCAHTETGSCLISR